MADDGDPNQNMGMYGGGGAQGADRQAIANISDQAKQVAATRQAAMQQNAAAGLKAATGGGGQVPPSLNDQIADHIMGLMKSPREQMSDLTDKIMELEKQAKDVEKSGTGNVTAQNAYLQVAAVLKARLHALQGQQTGTDQAAQAAMAQRQPPAAVGGQQ